MNIHFKPKFWLRIAGAGLLALSASSHPVWSSSEPDVADFTGDRSPAVLPGMTVEGPPPGVDPHQPVFDDTIDLASPESQSDSN